MDKYEIISNSHFTELEASEYLENQVKSLNNVVNSENEDYLLNVNDEEYVDYIVEKFSIPLPNIDFDATYASSYEDDIPAEKFPRSFHV